MNKHRLCVTGGSGFIGTSAVQSALDRKIEVLNFDIRPPKLQNQHSYWKYVDILDLSALIIALEKFKPTHILHLAAMTGMDIEHMSFFDSNTKGVQNLIDATSKLTQLKRIIFTSTLLVCKNGYVPISDIEYCPPNLYGESKVIGEKMVRDSQLQCDWLIVRPTSVWGPWFEHSYKTFFKVIDRGWYAQPGTEQIIKPLSFVGNTVYMMQKLLLHEGNEVSRKTYYLGDYPQHSIQTWADLIRTELGKPGKTPVLPVSVLRLLAKAGDCCKALGWIDPPLTSFRLNNMLTGAHYPIEKTKLIVGELPYSLAEGIQQTLKWMDQESLLRNKPA